MSEIYIKEEIIDESKRHIDPKEECICISRYETSKNHIHIESDDENHDYEDMDFWCSDFEKELNEYIDTHY